MIVAQEFIRGAVELVGPAFRDRVNHSARGRAEFSGEVTRLDCELVQSVERRTHHVACPIIETAQVIFVSRSVQQKGVLESAVAVCRKRLISRSAGGNGACTQVGHSKIVPAVQREFDHLIGGDDLRDGGRFVFDECSLSRNCDGLRSAAGLEREAQVDYAPHLHCYSLTYECLKTLS